MKFIDLGDFLRFTRRQGWRSVSPDALEIVKLVKDGRKHRILHTPGNKYVTVSIHTFPLVAAWRLARGGK